MRLMTCWMLVLTSCSSVAAPASRPVVAAGGGIATNEKIMESPLRASSLPASYPATLPAGRDVPVYTRGQLALILAGAELEKGAVAKQRDEQATRAKLSETFAERLQLELRAEQERARVLPWIVGGAAAAVGAALGAGLTALLKALEHKPAVAQ